MAGPGRRQGGSVRVVEVREEAPGVYLVVVEEGGERRSLRVRARDGVLETPWGSYHVSDLRGRRGGARRSRGGWLAEFSEAEGAVRARLPVRVVEARVEPGSRVSEGDVVLIVETMKMLNEVRAPCSGVVEELAEPGGGVAAGGLLFRIRCG